MSKHTPGPWWYGRVDNGNYKSRVHADHCTIATIHALTQQDANGALIAAAPELLSTLQTLADVSRSYIAHMDADDVAALDSARAAIAKATQP